MSRIRQDRPDDELNEDGIHPVVAEYGEMLMQAPEYFKRRDEPYARDDARRDVRPPRRTQRAAPEP